MAAIDNIVTLGLLDSDTSTSGYTLMQAAGMSPINLDKISNELDVQGQRLAAKKKAVALNMVRNDFLGYLQANNISPTLSHPTYNTSTFVPGINVGVYAGLRGVNLHKVGDRRSKLTKVKITSVQCYPLTSGAGEIIIQDTQSGVLYDFATPVEFVANRINTFAIEHICENPNVSVVIDQSTISFASAPIACGTGCNGSTPNDCAWADGWNGTAAARGEGYGINVAFQCFCDYDQVIADLSRSFSGQLIWLKWQELIFDEQYKSNRFDNWVVYNREDLPTYIRDAQQQYNSLFNSMSVGLFNILKTYNDPCLNCRGVRTLVNI